MTLFYSWVELKVSHQKLKLVIAIVFAMLIGGAVQGLARWGAVRSRVFSGIVGAAIGSLAVYFAWVWFLVIWDQWNFQYFLMDPTDIWREIELRIGLGRWQRRNQPIPSTELTLMFAGEALLIVGCSALMATRNRQPYCESCGKWTASGPALILPTTDAAELKRQLEDESYSALTTLASRPLTEGAGTSAIVHRCPDCRESNFLSLSRFTATTKGKETKVVTTPFMTHLVIPAEVADWVTEQAQTGITGSPISLPAT
jgi:hypothetical protein